VLTIKTLYFVYYLNKLLFQCHYFSVKLPLFAAGSAVQPLPIPLVVIGWDFRSSNQPSECKQAW